MKLTIVPHKKVVVFCLLVMFFITTCSTNDNNTKASNENNIGENTTIINSSKPIVNKNNGTYELVAEKVYEEYRYYSPDKRNYIKDVFEGEIHPDYLKVKVYLNDSTFIDNKDDDGFGLYVKSKGGIWLNNNEVLINGRFILNITDNSKTEIKLSNILTEGLWLHNYSVNRDSTKIAYLIVGNSLEKLYTYDINNKQWNEIYQISFQHTNAEFYNVGWDEQDNIYYDAADYTEDIFVKPIDEQEMKYKIYKYNSKNKKVALFKEDYRLLTFSPNRMYIALQSVDNENAIIYRVNDGAEVLRINNDSYSWSDEDTIAYFNNDKEINIYSLSKGKPISSIDVSTIISEGYSIIPLRYFERFAFYTYKKPQYGKMNLYQLVY